MKKKIELAVIALLLIIAIIVAVVYFTGHQKVDWQLYGALISEDGEIEQTVQFKLSGWVQTRYISNQVGTLKLTIKDLSADWPDDFILSDEEDCEYSILPHPSGGSRYWSVSYAWNGERYAPIHLEIFLEDQCLIYFGNALGGRYIVASTDPNADLVQLLKDSGSFKSN